MALLSRRPELESGSAAERLLVSIPRLPPRTSHLDCKEEPELGAGTACKEGLQSEESLWGTAQVLPAGVSQPRPPGIRPSRQVEQG